jgi:hypothetical protein
MSYTVLTGRSGLLTIKQMPLDLSKRQLTPNVTGHKARCIRRSPNAVWGLNRFVFTVYSYDAPRR